MGQVPITEGLVTEVPSENPFVPAMRSDDCLNIRVAPLKKATPGPSTPPLSETSMDVGDNRALALGLGHSQSTTEHLAAALEPER